MTVETGYERALRITQSWLRQECPRCRVGAGQRCRINSKLTGLGSDTMTHAARQRLARKVDPLAHRDPADFGK